MVEILVDDRERETGIVARLQSLGWDVRETRLTIGDYVIGGTIGIERKTVTDFGASLTSGRLFRQMATLKATIRKPLLLIEGDRASIEGVHPHAVQGALVSVSVRWYIPILWSRDVDETTHAIHLIAKQNSEIHQRWQSGGVKKSLTKRELQQRMLRMLPHMGQYSAETLLEQFGNIERLLTADEDELRQVKGIGKKRAAIVHDVLHEPSVTYRVHKPFNNFCEAKVMRP